MNTSLPALDAEWRESAACLSHPSILFFGVSSLLALYVIARFGVTPSAGSVTLATFLGVGAVGTLGGGWLADRYSRLSAIRLGYALCLPGLVLLLAARVAL